MPDCSNSPVDQRSTCGFKDGVEVVEINVSFVVAVVVGDDLKSVDGFVAFVDLDASVFEPVDDRNDASGLRKDAMEASFLLERKIR